MVNLLSHNLNGLGAEAILSKQLVHLLALTVAVHQLVKVCSLTAYAMIRLLNLL